MDYWIKVAGLLRRASIVVTLTLIALNVGAATWLLTPANYTVDTTQVLTMTRYGGTESPDPLSPSELTNPLLNFNDSLRTTSGILIQLMGSRDVMAQLDAVGATKLVVNDGRTNPDLLGLNGPFLYLVATSPSAQEATRVIDEAVALMQDKLLEWQEALEAPPRTFVRMAEVVAPGRPVPDRAHGVRLGVLAFAATFCVGLASAYLLVQRQDRRRPSGGGAVGTPEGAPPRSRDSASEPRRAGTAAQLRDEPADDEDDGEDEEQVSMVPVNGYAELTVLPALVKPKGRSKKR